MYTYFYFKTAVTVVRKLGVQPSSSNSRIIRLVSGYRATNSITSFYLCRCSLRSAIFLAKLQIFMTVTGLSIFVLVFTKSIMFMGLVTVFTALLFKVYCKRVFITFILSLVVLSSVLEILQHISYQYIIHCSYD